MIILDTHIWVWWVDGSSQLTVKQQGWLQQYQTQEMGVSVISCWEVAKLVEYNKLVFQCPVDEWIEQALAYPGIRLLELTPRIAIESTQLPGQFHRDPADQIIVATARVWDCPLLTADSKILGYPHVTTLQ
jgi:PIN domain nuclease of toxin-antitoxin system